METTPTQKSQSTTLPFCEGHNWELQRNIFISNPSTAIEFDREVAYIICTFCGIVRKTNIEKVFRAPHTYGGQCICGFTKL